MHSPFECVLDVKASLGEGPVWSVDEQILYWVDINAPALNRFDPATAINTAWPMPQSIGSFALRASGGFVGAMRDGFWLISRDGRPQRKLIGAPYDPAHHRFNDGRADPHGRFWAGSMNEKRDANTACLYRLDADVELTAMVPDLMISNGLAWSPDARTMYHSDTPARTIWTWDFDAATGAIANRRVFARFDADKDRPDGAAVERIAEYPLPALAPTMCAFGGPDLKTLYVTTARQRREADELARLPLSGGIFAMRVDVAGLPEPKFAG